jgi:TfoX/Sxy family transcriptional regulator of competence genes
MAYNEPLAERVRTIMTGWRGLQEKKMFGGLAWLTKGRMFAGVLKDELVVRVGPEAYEQTLKKPHTRPMDFTGRPITGFIFVGSQGATTKKQLAAWVRQGYDFAAGLASSAPRRPRPGRRRRREPVRLMSVRRVAPLPSEE